MSAAAGPAHADWPVARHDARRTATTSAPSNLVEPVPYFRRYLGGQVGEAGLLTGDVDANGSVDVVYLSGGSVVAKRPDDSPLWKTPPLGVTALWALTDLDGDGKLDVVAQTPSRAIVLTGATGAIAWEEPDGEIGTLAGVRVTDLSGDGHPDLYLEENPCGGVVGPSSGHVYSFAGGLGSPALLWNVPDRPHCGSAATTVVDLDGDGHDEVVVGSLDDYRAVKGSDGSILATTPSLGMRPDYSSCVPTDLDGKPGQELVCFWTSAQRKIVALHYDASATPPALAVLWQAQLGDDPGGDATFAPEAVLDLDADGSLEVVGASATAQGVWTTHVFDGKTGTELATIPGGLVAGAARLASANKALVLTMAGANLEAWAFQRGASPTVTKRWSMPARSTFQFPDATLLARTTAYRRLATLDLDGDGVQDLVSSDGSGSIVVSKSTGAQPVDLASYALPKDTMPQRLWVEAPLDRPYFQLVVARSDGYLNALDAKLVPTNVPGLRLGGYSSTTAGFGRAPVVGSLDGGAKQTVLVDDNRGALLALDATDSSLAVPPKVLWERAGTVAPAIVPGLVGGKVGIACRGADLPPTVPQTFHLAALEPNGSTSWKVPLDPDTIHDVVPGNLDGDAVPDLLVEGYGQDGNARAQGFSGANGAKLWETAGVGVSIEPFASADWDGDGRDDVIGMFGALRAYSGKDGSLIGDGVKGISYFMPILASVDGDAQLEVTLQGGYDAARTMAHDLSTPIWVGEDDRPYLNGAVVSCDGAAPVLVEGSSAHPARIKVTTLGGAAAGASTARVLAGGKLFADEDAAKAAGMRLGALGDVTASTNLTGKGHPTALVPSSDGFLYGLDPCGFALDFAVDFGASVAEAVLGDADGDGADEILVTVGDGFLYGLKHQVLPSPAWIHDTDPNHGIPVDDVDDIVTTSTLWAAWAPVASAAAYEIAAVAEGGDPVTSPVWKNVGTATKATLDALPLVDGRRYDVAVRALTGEGKRSPDRLSNGVRVHFTAGAGGAGGAAGAGGATGKGGGGVAGGHPGAGGAPATMPSSDQPTVTGDGCGCAVPSRSGSIPATAAAIALAAALVARRRRAPRSR
jgi:hypothetical protein